MEAIDTLRERYPSLKGVGTTDSDRIPFILSGISEKDGNSFVAQFNVDNDKNCFYEDASVFCKGKHIGLCLADILGLRDKGVDDFGDFIAVSVEEPDLAGFTLVCDKMDVDEAGVVSA